MRIFFGLKSPPTSPTEEGFEIYHDVPFEGFNIDHVFVDPPGVCASPRAGHQANAAASIPDLPVPVFHEPLQTVAELGAKSALESLPLERLNTPPENNKVAVDRHCLESVLTTHAAHALHPDLEHRGNLSEGAWYSSRLLGVLLAL